jgi:hypothetical protein
VLQSAAATAEAAATHTIPAEILAKTTTAARSTNSSSTSTNRKKEAQTAAAPAQTGKRRH